MKKYILTIILVSLITSNVLSQPANWISTWFGSTNTEILQMIDDKKNTLNTYLFNQKNNEIVFTYRSSDDTGMMKRNKVTCYFKNNIFYKYVDEETTKSSGENISNRVFGWHAGTCEDRFYEYRKNMTFDYKQKDGSIISYPCDTKKLIKYPFCLKVTKEHGIFNVYSITYYYSSPKENIDLTRIESSANGGEWKVVWKVETAYN